VDPKDILDVSEKRKISYIAGILTPDRPAPNTVETHQHPLAPPKKKVPEKIQKTFLDGKSYGYDFTKRKMQRIQDEDEEESF
jgi:hypothetical protein